jgi:hypothetical protein
MSTGPGFIRNFSTRHPEPCYMKLSLSWPKEFLSGEKPVAETVEDLTFAGVEVEVVE